MSKKILVIVGPTASGKSGLAVRLAKKFGGEIISADSRQVYKNLDIGTGKITKKEMQGVPHHLLDVVDPRKQFSVSEYKKLAVKKIEKIKLPIIVGGTGFYIDAVARRTDFPDIPPNKKLRNKLNKKTEAELFKMLQKKDPRRAKNIDRYNKVRLIRALEIVGALGGVPKLKLKKNKNFIYIGLRPIDLKKRIKIRLLKRLSGMIKEAEKLRRNGLSYKRMHELGLEYRFLALYLKGRLSKKEFVERLNTAIDQYAKRQMTWFKRNKEIVWFEPEEYEKIERYVKRMVG